MTTPLEHPAQLTPTITLELRTSRESEQAAAAMAAVLSALPHPPRQFWLFWQAAPWFTLEFFNQGQSIYALLTLPRQLQEYVTSQLSANYPEILVKVLEHNPLSDFVHPKPKAMSEVFLSASSAYPLLSFEESKETDPLAAVLSTLSKLQADESAVIQLQFRKNREVWKKRVTTTTSAASATATGEVVTVHTSTHHAAVAKKLKETSFQFTLRILTQAVTQARADQLRDSLVTSLSAFQSESNSLVGKTPFLGKQRFVTAVIERRPKRRAQYLSQPELATIFHLPYKQLSNIKNITWGKTLLGEPPENLPTFTHSPETERNDLNLFAKTEYKNKEEIFGIHRRDRRRHMYVIGKSGTGKSTLLANMIINDLKHNEGMAVIDPHGDLIETVLNYIPKHRINDVIVFDPADPHAVVKLNLFEGGSVVHRELIASGIVAIFQKMYAASWGPRLEYILRNTLLTLLSENAKLGDVLQLLTDADYRAKVVDRLQDPVLKNFWVAEFNPMQDKLRTESISPILNKVGQFVTSPLIRNVVNTPTSSFDIETIMNQGKILLVNLSQGKLGEDNTAMLGAMMITKIQLAAMNRVYTPEEERRDFYLYIDEFQNFATTSFIKILSEARKYRLDLILANQYIDQIPEEVKSAIFGNAGTIISFILGASDADWMMKEFGSKYSQEDLVSLSRYQIVTKLMIDGRVSHPFPANTLDLASSSNQNREKVLQVSRERYAKRK